MNIKIHSSELNRMMKTITQCINPKDSANKANIEIGILMNQLYIHASDGHFTATMTTPYLGDEKEKFCVDGQMFARVCSMCSGEIEIVTSEKTCTIKGAGRTKLPVVNAKIPRHDDVIGNKVIINGGEFTKCFNSVAYAVSTDQTRIQLTGVLVNVLGGVMKMTALDGFQLSVESIECSGDDMRIIIPASFMKLLSQAVDSGEQITLYSEGHRLTATTDSMTLSCGLFSGDFPDAEKLLPNDFKTECIVNVEELRNALRCGSVVNNRQNLVKLEISENNIRVSNNGDSAEFEADVPCETQGSNLKIAFNIKYLMNTINTINSDKAILHMNTSISPCIVNGQDEVSIRLVLPVRVQG